MLLLLAISSTTAAAEAAADHAPSPGCQSCCDKQAESGGAWAAYIDATAAHVQEECSTAFEGISAGMCCGGHPSDKHLGCCPLGGTCVQCATSWRCSRERVVTGGARCSICAADRPSDCYTMWFNRVFGDAYFFEEYLTSILFFVMLIICLTGGSCWTFRRRRMVVIGGGAGSQAPIARGQVLQQQQQWQQQQRQRQQQQQGPSPVVQGVVSGKAML